MNWESESRWPGEPRRTNQSRYAWELEKIDPDSVIDESTPSPLQQVLQRECLGKVFEVMQTLPRRDVKVFMMRTYEGRTLEETRHHVINTKTGVPISKERVRQIGDRALGKLRSILIDGGYGLE